MRDYVLSWYIPPVLSLGIAIYMLAVCLRHIRQAISELSDNPLPEQEQLKILKALTGHDSEFSSFGGIKSRCTGTSVTIDIYVSFPPDTRFEAISRFQKALQEELAGQIERCRVAVVIDNNGENM